MDGTGNWRPQSPSVNQDYYSCLKEAQQGYSQGGLFTSESGAKTNCNLLASCMSARGYGRRRESALEVLSDVVLFPIYWMAAIGGTCFFG